MSATDFAGGDEGQMDLFANPDGEKQRRLDEALDRIKDKYGDKCVRRSGV